MEYIYAAMLLHKAGKKVEEASVKKVLEAAGVKVDESRVKALVAALEGGKIEKAAVPVAVAPVAGAGTHVSAAGGAKKAEEKDEEEEKKSAEKAAAGLG